MKSKKCSKSMSPPPTGGVRRKLACSSIEKAKELLRSNVFIGNRAWIYCQVPGCKITFSNLQHLKTHMSKVHTNVTIEKVKCLKTECNSPFVDHKECISHLALNHAEYVLCHDVPFLDEYFYSGKCLVCIFSFS